MFGDTVSNNNCFDKKRLSELADIVSGITKGRKTKESDLIEVPYMAVSNVKDGYIVDVFIHTWSIFNITDPNLRHKQHFFPTLSHEEASVTLLFTASFCLQG